MVSLTPDLERSLERSLQLAQEYKHQYATLEHLLLALIDVEDVAAVMTACGVDLGRLRNEIVDYLENDCGSFVVEGLAQAHPTAAFQRAIQRAVLRVENLGLEEVSGANVLVSMFAERDSYAVAFLTEQNMTRHKAITWLSHGFPGEEGQAPGENALDEADMVAREAVIRRALAEDRALMRAARLAPPPLAPPFYLIRIGGIDTSASIGIHGFEQASRQKLRVSVILLLDPPQVSHKAGDQIASVQDYDFVREGVLRLVSGGHFNLQETLCSAILDLCLAQKAVLGAVVQTDKPDVYPGVAAVACRMARMGPRMGDDFPWWTIGAGI